MSITVDQYSNRIDNGGSVSWGTNPQAGSKVLLGISAFYGGGGAPTIVSVADNGTSPATWVADLSFLNSFGNGEQWIYRADGITLPASGGWVVTVTWGNMTVSEIGAISLLGAASGAPFATQHNEGSGPSSSSVSAGTGAGAGSYYLAHHNDNASTPETETTTGAFTQRFSQGAAGMHAWQLADFIGSGNQTASFSWTGTGANAARDVIAVYSPAAATSTPPPFQRRRPDPWGAARVWAVTR